MNVNRKLGRLKHWAGEKMGGEVRTTATDEFKGLEVEMGLRQEGMERLHRSMNVYVKSLSKRSEGEDSKEKSTAVSQLGASAISHADDFEPESEFGQCLSSFGRANERIARIQESYVSSATSTWLESLERSLAQMKEYQTSRKKLESRRLAFDSSQSRLQKSKKDDFKLEEELRSQKAKYEESNEDVYRRMLDIRESEAESIADLGNFLDAELAYYDRCREILVQLKEDWPGQTAETTPSARRTRILDPSDPIPMRPRVPSFQHSPSPSPMRERGGYDFTPSRPSPGSRRTSAFDTRPSSPASLPRLSRVPTDTSVLSARAGLRPVRSRADSVDVFSDAAAEDEDEVAASGRWSPGTAPGSRSVSVNGDGSSKKMAPPPPPSRAKKPPPPPPPMRSSTGLRA